MTIRLIIFIDDILVYFKSKTERADRLRRILQLLRGEKLYASFRCVSFGLEGIRFLGQVVNRDSIHLDSSRDAAVSNWRRPETDKVLSTSRFSRVL